MSTGLTWWKVDLASYKFWRMYKIISYTKTGFNIKEIHKNYGHWNIISSYYRVQWCKLWKYVPLMVKASEWIWILRDGYLKNNINCTKKYSVRTMLCFQDIASLLWMSNSVLRMYLLQLSTGGGKLHTFSLLFCIYVQYHSKKRK